MSVSTPLSAGAGTTRAFTSRWRLRSNPISLVLGAIVLLVGAGAGLRMNTSLPIAAAVIAFVPIILGLQMAYAWEAAVVLRAGRGLGRPSRKSQHLLTSLASGAKTT
jgi:hypothetical protein